MKLFNYDAYINLSKGEIIPGRTTVTEKERDGAYAVYIKALSLDRSFTEKSNYSIDMEKGVTIELKPNQEIKSYMANYKRGEYWCAPHFGKEFNNMPDETQLLLMELADGGFLAVVPVVNEEYKCVFKGRSEDAFSARIFSWCENMYACEGLAFVYSIADKPSAAITKCVRYALDLLPGGVRHRTERTYPEIFEYLGWCSWDSMQIRVSEDGLVEKCDEFINKGIPVKWMMIDDMWAHIKDFYGETYADFKEMIRVMYSSAMYHFEADPIRFPGGLKSCISKLKDKGMAVGVWHPTTGYWRGIDKNGEAYKILKDYLITASNGYIVPDWTQKNSFMYYDTMHSFFRECGAEIVKVDNQSMTRRYYKNLAPVGRVAREFHKGMDASIGSNFKNAAINCMGMSSEDIWNRVSSPVSRCSDDFLPENREWFAKHVLQCAYNSMLQGEFYWCDWDMWWTDDGQAKKNSIMRAISGGPIYVSDMIGRSNKEILTPLVLDDGKILRCDRPCIATYDCATVDPTTGGKAIKLQNTVGEYGVLAAFNIDAQNSPVTAEIGGKYVDGFDAEEYAVYEHFSGELRILRADETFEITLRSNDDYKLYILAPIKDGFAALGRIDKFISPKAIKCISGQDILLYEDGPCGYVLDGKLYVKDM